MTFTDSLWAMAIWGGYGFILLHTIVTPDEHKEIDLEKAFERSFKAMGHGCKVSQCAMTHTGEEMIMVFLSSSDDFERAAIRSARDQAIIDYYDRQLR